MKKFLGILGTIVTAGSGMTGIVGNAPALAKNEINYLQTNNLKTLNRNKRAISSLNIPEVQQLGSAWCGPAVVESILRYMGVTWEDVINGEQVNTLYYHNFQNYLASLMRTNEVDRLEEPIPGTLPSNLLEVLNTFINRYVSPSIHSSLNRNFYGSTVLARGYTNLELFYNYVSNSLNNNIPVVLGFSGTLPGWSECTNQVNHFIAIYQMTEVQNNDFGSVNYTYMDPANGLNRGVFTGDDLTMDLTQGRNESVLLHYNPSITEWNTNNSTIALQTLEEAMEIDYAGVRCSIATQASRRKRRSNENKIQCSNEKKFYFNEVKNNIKLESVYDGSNNHRTEVKKLFTFNLGKINPLTFSKLSFLFDEGEDDNSSTYASLGNESFYGEKINDFFKDRYIKDIIRNKKINNENEIKSSDLNFLQSINPYHLIVSQKIGLTFYWENDNYYLQFLTYQFAENYTVFPQGGIIWMKIGKGIKLYN